VRVLDGMDRDAQWLKQRAGVVAEAVREGKEELVRPDQAFLETTVKGLMAGEPDVRAEVGVPRTARLAPSARDRRIDRHSLSGVRPVQRHAGELVPRHHRRVDGDLAGTAFGVPVEIGAAQPDRRDGDGGPTRSWCGRTVGLLHAKVPHGVELHDSVHGPHHHRRRLDGSPPTLTTTEHPDLSTRRHTHLQNEGWSRPCCSGALRAAVAKALEAAGETIGWFRRAVVLRAVNPCPRCQTPTVGACAGGSDTPFAANSET
jgi:hypothetical protein